MCIYFTVHTACTGSGEVRDECGRVCTCKDGVLVDCCRLRLDFSTLPAEDRTRYINAVLTISSDPKYKARYDALIALYNSSFGTDAQSLDYKTSHFFVWSRYFMIEYENLLQEVDCRITIPYYDWSVFSMSPYSSPVWNDETGFGKSSRPSDYCVDSGPFQVDQFFLTPSAGGGCLKREYKVMTFPSRSLIERDILTLHPSEFNKFQRGLQIFVHTNIRCFIGGTLCTTHAANDPIFLLHLAMLDYIFDRWQSFSSDHLEARYAGDNTALVLAGGEITVTQLHDNSNLPGGLAVCYAEPYVKNHGQLNLQYSNAQALSESSTVMDCTDVNNLIKSGIKVDESIRTYIEQKCNRRQREN